ncbi:MAG: beta-L-arabinofuranosidase domain-containing protein [Halobacteriales archaeon]
MADLTPREYRPLPLGDIEPRGWLRRQLRIQADGLTGHIDEFWPDLADNMWLGGEHDGWERGPYYVDGLVPLAHLLGDDDLLAKAERWIDAFEERDDEGWIGPPEPADTDSYEAYDPWPRFVVLKALRQHYEATGDGEALDAMLDFCRYLLDALPEDELFSWGRYRWADLAVTVHWLHDETGEDWLLDLGDLAAEQGYDWAGHFAGHLRSGFAYTGPQPPDQIEMETHVVNNAMGIKSPAVRYRQSGAAADREAVIQGLHHLDLFHGQATGLFSGDEHFGGTAPTRGTELCAVVEYMYSLEYLVSAFGDTAFADRLERIAYNALPATFTPDMWAHQYDQQANQVLCSVHDRPGWSNDPDANIYGLEPHYGCCTANYHQGWPKLASHLWMRRGEGLAAVAYAPCAVSTTAGGVDVDLTVETDYPFGDEVEVAIDPAAAATFPVEFRIPGWAEDATLTLPDGEERSPDPGGFHAVEREWSPGDVVGLSLAAPVEVERRHHGAATVKRGPLVFSLGVEAERRLVGGEPPHGDWEFHPVEPWNYGLGAEALGDADVTFADPRGTPFGVDDPPATLRVEGARVPEWGLEAGSAGEVPASPVAAEEAGPTEALTLVPYGCTNLRVTEFPLIAD